MITLGQLTDILTNETGKMATDDRLQFLTWKGDRGFEVTRTPGGFSLREHGYAHHEDSYADVRQLLKAATKIAKREFPRSNKLRFHHDKNTTK